MYLSKGEYSQFSLKGRVHLLQEFGMLVKEKFIDNVRIEIFLLYDFYVEVVYTENHITKAEPVLHAGLMEYYL